jgi:Asp-tRNA(Asn)/Glu-tRNA(Gln) amidotransferase B subunit
LRSRRSTPGRLGGLIDLIEHGAISGRIAEGVFSIMLERS